MAKKTTSKTTRKKNPSTGVMLIAVGHPYYGRMAANLAMSIKDTAPDVKIALAHDNGSLSQMTEFDLSLFDKKLICKDDYTHMHGVPQYIMSKLYMYELSPFDHTLFLDVDMVWHPRMPITKLIDSLKDVDFTMQNRGVVDLSEDNISPGASHWVNFNDLKEAYGIKKGSFWNLSSEMVWFKKTKEVKAMFRDAQKHYRTIKVSHTSFAGGVPDELCLAMSMLKHTDIVPHKLYYTPIYWNQADDSGKHMDLSELYSQYYAYSLGGAVNHRSAKRFYNDLVRHYAHKRGIPNNFKAKDKRSFISDRTEI